MTSELIIFAVIVFIGLMIIDSNLHKERILTEIYIGMPVDTMHNGILSHGYITAFNNQTVTIVLFDAPHDLIERKITEIIF